MAQAQDVGRVDKAALTMSRAEHGTAARDTDIPKAVPAEKERHATRKTGRSATAKTQSRNRVPRTTFEDRTAHYFDPLSLTLAPDPDKQLLSSPYSRVTSPVIVPDKNLIAVTPDDPTTHDVSSASIENMGQGKNVTVVVPLFQILNNLSPGPAPPPQ